MIRETVGHLRDLPRYRQILTGLVRYGYQDVVTALRLEGIVRPFERAALGAETSPHDRPARLRMLCEELGPSFVKLGQIMSTRADLLPESYTAELSLLRDSARSFPFEQVEAILLEEFGRSAHSMFRSIDPEPTAAASISQVHRAILHDGQVAAVKIQRPAIAKIVRADLDILKNLAQLVERRIRELAVYRPVALAHEFERTIKRELDFTIERASIERCRRLFAGDSTIHVVRTFPEYCTSRVLTMEFIEGAAINDREAILGFGQIPEEVADRGARIVLEMVFRHGFFHADPHPGNLRVLESGVIAPLDYGIFGQLDAITRERIADLLSGLIAQDPDRVLRALKSLDVRINPSDTRAFRRDLAELTSSYSDLSLETISLSPLLHEIFTLARTHRIQIPADLVLLIRALVGIESVARTLDPRFDIAARLRPLLRELYLRRLKPDRILQESLRAGEDLRRIATILPEVLSQSLESIRQGQLKVNFDLQGMGRLVRHLTRASNSLTVGIVVAGLLVASALVLRSGLPIIAYSGFALGLVLCCWLVWNMSRD